MNHLWRSAQRTLLAGVAATAVGCAHTATAVPAASPDPEFMVVTGSRIPQPVDARTGYPITPDILRIYTYDDLYRTGHPDVVRALRQLDPSFGR
jgi:hypothetical protein